MLSLGLVIENIGIFVAIGRRREYRARGPVGSPISGASMNPARTFGPDLASGSFTDGSVYMAALLTGALIAVGVAFVLGGAGDGSAGEPPRRTCSPEMQQSEQP